MPMSPEQAIGALPELLKQLNSPMHFLGLEADAVSEQWDGLGRVGGQRADHAAMLLGRLRPHLRDIAKFCVAVEKQIDGMIADPFQRKEVRNA